MNMAGSAHALMLSCLVILIISLSNPVSGRLVIQDVTKTDDNNVASEETIHSSSSSSNEEKADDNSVEDEGDDDDDDMWPVLCPEQTFYSKEKEVCAECSWCPDNQIIITPCEGLHDTVCGPFYEFQKFGPAGVNSKDDFTKQKGDSIRSHPFDQVETAPDASDWKSLSMTLFFVIVAIFIVFLVAILAVLYIRRRMRMLNNKEDMCEYSAPPTDV